MEDLLLFLMVVCHQGYGDLKVMPFKVGVKMIMRFGNWMETLGNHVEILKSEQPEKTTVSKGAIHPNLPPPPNKPRVKRANQLKK